MTVVKICGLTNLEDARWACRCGADLLGFVFVPSSARCVPAARVAKIIHALTSEGYRARPVGVFANQPLDALRRTAEMCSLQLVQLHGGEGPGYAHALGLPFIVARRVRDRVPWEELSEYQAWAYLLDSYDPGKLGGTGHAWRWEMLGDPQPDVRLIVAGGLTPDNVASAIRQARPWGVDVSSGVEASPGRKAPAIVERFVREAKRAAAPATASTRPLPQDETPIK